MSVTTMSQRMLAAGAATGKFHSAMPAEYIEDVMQDTWGHMAPKVREIYTGHVLFSRGIYAGDYLVNDYDFRLADGTELDGGPWFFTDVHDQVLGWIAQKGDLNGGIWRFEGTFERLKNGKSRWRGKVIPMRLQYRFNRKKR